MKNFLLISIAKFNLLVLLLIVPFTGAGQEIKLQIATAKTEMRYANLYNKIQWGMSALNEYHLDQTKGVVEYTVSDFAYNVVAKVEMLGTFNIATKTFMWADKNPSIKKPLSSRVKELKKTLPKQYKNDTFEANADLCADLLALFSNAIKANGFDYQRQENTIVYFALMEIEVFRYDKLYKTIKLEPHIQLEENKEVISTFKTFHSELTSVNRRYHVNEITQEQAFEKIKKVHLTYWYNEDEYYYPALAWPCPQSEKMTLDWQAFTLISEDRHFVSFATDLGWTLNFYAYEISKKGTGVKLISNQF